MRFPAAPGKGAIPVRDLSRAGLCCHLPDPLPLMTQVGLRLEVPGGEGRYTTVTGTGAVVRCVPAPPDAPGAYEVAIFFVDMSEAHRRVLDRYVAAHQPSAAALP